MTADPEWTVSTDFFEDCLRFFASHYSVVDIADVLASIQGKRSLPRRPLLITIDDGWADTEEYAARILRRMNLPAVVFVVVESVGGRELWQETIRRLWRSEHLRSSILEVVRETGGERLAGLPEVIQRLSSFPTPERRVVIQTLLGQFRGEKRDEMVSLEQVRGLRDLGCTVGSHGLTHTSIPLAADAWSELYESRVALAQVLGEPPDRGPAILSFPNGRHDADVLALAGKAGYVCLFTSDSHLNSFRECPHPPVVLGRANISSCWNSDGEGRLRPELLASWLFRRPLRQPQ